MSVSLSKVNYAENTPKSDAGMDVPEIYVQTTHRVCNISTRSGPGYSS